MNPVYPWIDRPQEAHFLRRLNRFLCLVNLAHTTTHVYLPNSGRLEELLVPGSKVIVEQRRRVGKTYHDLLLAQSSRYPDGQPIWVGLDSRLPSALLRWTIEQGLLTVFGTAPKIQMEPRAQHGRLDLLLQDRDLSHLVETKSVNLLDGEGTARFPDAPTVRGRRHVETLIQHQAGGVQCWMVFVILREDAQSFSPFLERDPPFAQALWRARTVGVGVIAVRYSLGPAIRFLGTVPFYLPPRTFPGSWPPALQEQ